MEDINEKMPWTFEGKENLETAQRLQAGETCKVTGYGNSMTPILLSGQPVVCEPVRKDTVLRKRDIILCKVKGHFYLHLIWAVKKGRGGTETYLIGNNHGHPNGTIGRSQIYGRVIQKL